MTKLLLIDDEAPILEAFDRAYRDSGVTLITAKTAAEGIRLFERETPDTLILDIHLPDSRGLETFHKLRELGARTPVILITGHGTTDLAIEAIKQGAFDYLIKPLELTAFRHLVNQAVRSGRLTSVPAVIPEMEPERAGGDAVIGRSPAMQHLYKSIARVAGRDDAVLIRGEPGTGKELIARAVYRHSERASRPFVAVTCGGLGEREIESELFGHEQGAFTGAERLRIGRLEQAREGTLFLEEIGTLPERIRTRLARALKDRQFERCGGTAAVPFAARIIASCSEVAHSTLIAELEAAFGGAVLYVPPLRERRGDIPLLADHFVKLTGPHGVVIAPEAMHRLQVADWPGNVRELRQTVNAAMMNRRGAILLPENFAEPAATPIEAPSRAPFDWDHFVNERIAAGTTELYDEMQARMEREIFLRVLRHTEGNQVKSAKILGITRSSLRLKLRSHGITINREIGAVDDAE